MNILSKNIYGIIEITNVNFQFFTMYLSINKRRQAEPMGIKCYKVLRMYENYRKVHTWITCKYLHVMQIVH